MAIDISAVTTQAYILPFLGIFHSIMSPVNIPKLFRVYTDTFIYLLLYSKNAEGL